MTGPGRYLCGCSPQEKGRYSGDVINGPMGQPIYTDKRYDALGYEVCPEHGERLYGWITHDPNRPHYVSNGQGQPPTFHSPEQKVKLNFEILASTGDQRDNRDPEAVYAELSASRTVAKNGHAKLPSVNDHPGYDGDK